MAIYFRFSILRAVTFPRSRFNSERKRLILLWELNNAISLRIGSRTLLSDATTNIENYARQRIFKVDQLQDGGNKVTLFQTLQALSRPGDARRILPLIVDSLHCAETEEECNIVESVLRLLRSHKDESGRQEFHFGASLFRMYHFLRMPERALAIYQDPQLKKLVEDNTCHILLMDLLYKSKQYDNALKVFSTLSRFDSNCYTLALGALYHINTPESHKQSQSLISQVQKSEHSLQRRAIIFSVMLALNQGKAKEALGCLSLCKFNNITRNIELICRSRLGQFEKIFNVLDGSLIAAKNTTQILSGRIYQDTWLEIQSAMKTSNASNVGRLRQLETRLRHSGLLSSQKTSVLLERKIPGDKDYKRQRAKRLIERSKPD